jgi:hypothetical protein
LHDFQQAGIAAILNAAQSVLVINSIAPAPGNPGAASPFL